VKPRSGEWWALYTPEERKHICKFERLRTIYWPPRDACPICQNKLDEHETWGHCICSACEDWYEKLLDRAHSQP